MIQLDRYKRLLAYVYLQDGTFVNAWLVEHGFAQLMTVPPNVKHQDLFLRLQQEAREAGRGCGGEEIIAVVDKGAKGCRGAFGVF